MGDTEDTQAQWLTDSLALVFFLKVVIIVIGNHLSDFGLGK